MNIIDKASLGLAVFAVVACGASIDDTNQSSSHDAPEHEMRVLGTQSGPHDMASADLAREEVLAEVNVDGELVTFLRLGEGTGAVMAMTSQGSTADGSAVQALAEREGDLTFLEIFQALAPDQIPPGALIEAHSVQVAQMNRSDDRVRSVDKAVPPPGVNVCDDSLFYFAPLTWTNVTRGGALSGGDAYICVSNTGSGNGQVGGGQPTSTTCPFATELRKMAGLCNRGTATMATFAAFGTATTWQATTSVTVPPGEYFRWDFAPTPGIPQRLAAVGISSAGGGASYGLRSGTAQ